MNTSTVRERVSWNFPTCLRYELVLLRKAILNCSSQINLFGINPLTSLELQH